MTANFKIKNSGGTGYVRPCHHSVPGPQVVDGGNSFQIWKVAGTVLSLNKQSWPANKG
jgi:hypothetical protein